MYENFILSKESRSNSQMKIIHKLISFAVTTINYQLSTVN